MMALQNMGVELLPLFAGLGVAGVGVSLAMQGVLSNLSAGLTIIFTRPFRVGEYIALIGVEGQVESIELFSTRLYHLDHSHVVIPNRKIVGEVLQNYGKIRQLDLAVGVSYSGDLEKALRTIHAVLAQNPYVCPEPAPLVLLSVFDNSSLRIAVKPWVKVLDYVVATGAINAAIFTAFRELQIDIPFPQQEVRLLTAIAETPK
jgi:small conductance mechanosensitive channel